MAAVGARVFMGYARSPWTSTWHASTPAGQPAEAVAQFQKMERPWQINLAAAYARLGKLDEARASIAKVLKDKPGWTIKDEAVWPAGQPQFIEPLLKLYLADLAKAGLPEK